MSNGYSCKYTNHNICALTFCQGGVKGLPMRSKPYRNERIVQVLRTFFFIGGTSSYARRYEHKFKVFTGSDGVALREVPIHMVALVATAVRVTYELGHHTNAKLSYMPPFTSGGQVIIRLLTFRPTATQTRTMGMLLAWNAFRSSVLQHFIQ
jgi:hypothetical protein